VEYASRNVFPERGETGKIYVALDTNKTYRWSGTLYVIVGGTGDVTDVRVNNVSVVNSGIANIDLSSKAERTDTILATTLSRGRKENTRLGTGSIAFGYNVTATGVCAQAFGGSTVAEGNCSQAIGGSTNATGDYSFAEGSGTMSSGAYSHSEGDNTTASGQSSHTQGTGTIANHKSQNVSGEFNVADTSSATASQRGNYIEIVGNGTAIESRSNARTLDWDGNERLMGDLYVGCNADGTGGTKIENVAFATNSEIEDIINNYGVSA
jgi:hypothetical protein